VRKIVPRLSPALAIAMVALFVALSGTAVATTSALITGKQIKNSSITGADVKNKSLTSRDFRGSIRGARGPAGPAGPAGAQGAQGPAGPEGPFPSGDIPAGKTIRGHFALYDRATAASEYQYTSISFGFRLASPPTIHYIKNGAAAPAECPGSVAAPEAAAGHLCVYESATISNVAADRNAWLGLMPASTGRIGAAVYTSSAAAGFYYTLGTWAVTSG
jgi:hypothetical protein